MDILSITEDELFDLYIIKSMSQEEIAKELNCLKKEADQKLKEYKINKRSINNNCNMGVVDNRILKHIIINKQIISDFSNGFVTYYNKTYSEILKNSKFVNIINNITEIHNNKNISLSKRDTQIYKILKNSQEEIPVDMLIDYYYWLTELPLSYLYKMCPKDVGNLDRYILNKVRYKYSVHCGCGNPACSNLITIVPSSRDHIPKSEVYLCEECENEEQKLLNINKTLEYLNNKVIIQIYQNNVYFFIENIEKINNKDLENLEKMTDSLLDVAYSRMHNEERLIYLDKIFSHNRNISSSNLFLSIYKYLTYLDLNYLNKIFNYDSESIPITAPALQFIDDNLKIGRVLELERNLEKPEVVSIIMGLNNMNPEDRTFRNMFLNNQQYNYQTIEKHKESTQDEKDKLKIKKLKTMPYKEYLQTDHWKKTRKSALERAKYKCALCGDNKDLNVHHNTYENRGCEKDEDLVVLCHDCHAKFHNKSNDKEEIPIIEDDKLYSINDILNMKLLKKEDMEKIIHKLIAS